MERKWYRVADGVDHVNGARVPEDRRVYLADIEAAFDLGLDRIAVEPTSDEVEPEPPELEPEKSNRRGRSS